MDELSGLIEAGTAERLERAARTAAGDSLRSLTVFTDDAFEQLYLRSDLAADADLAGFVELETDAFRARAAYRGSELGGFRHTIRVFESGFLVCVADDERGAFVTTDGLTVRRSREVASAIRDVLAGIEAA